MKLGQLSELQVIISPELWPILELVSNVISTLIPKTTFLPMKMSSPWRTVHTKGVLRHFSNVSINAVRLQTIIHSVTKKTQITMRSVALLNWTNVSSRTSLVFGRTAESIYSIATLDCIQHSPFTNKLNTMESFWLLKYWIWVCVLDPPVPDVS